MKVNLNNLMKEFENRKSFWIGSIVGVIIIVIIAVLIYSAANNKYSAEQLEYIKKVEESRASKNDWMKNDPASPFNAKGKVEFHNLQYFPVEPEWVFESKLNEFEQKDEIFIYGTKGEIRKTIRYGYITFSKNEIVYKLNVYQSQTPSGKKYYSIWFTDKTTNNESYGVGRYIDFEINEDINHIYTIDFNLAYNPYCAYSPDYSCAMPTKEDYLPLEIKAGEKKFHD